MTELTSGLNLAHDQIRASTVKGTDVYNAEGERLGHIDDIILAKQSGKATFAVMSFGSFLGMGGEYHPLPWESLHYDRDRGGYVVNVSREQLEKAPHYRTEQEPDWNDTRWSDNVTRHYLPPYL